MTNLLDVLKEADLRINFTDNFKTVAAHERLDREEIQKRLILALYGLGTNTGLKRISAGNHGESYQDLLYIKRKFINYATALRLGTAETESILKRFTRNNLKHPTYLALAELGKAIKTIFLCEYLNSEELRMEIHAGLNLLCLW
ncbi:Tn3 transposase DDE domain protein [Clostridium magnum DSM 2767]|uniref:Tn3 transposase DDE domain protein n=1 Tax=Clostridium magnum DSM 2767 TaxID=1121326 RepID=A0A162QGS2_9CLOT|nr:Tn3 transposase DDE domain protein [Clostridium magnum DSM 2767]SHI14858.1 Tn3 transposase DDE domain-containing protein [Clostridium magnum DSM 2767]